MIVIRTHRNFDKAYRKLPTKIKEQAIKKETAFKQSPFNLQLKTHKLHGKDKDSWAFWINDSYRIKFIFLSDNEVLFLDVGTHDVYK